MKLYINDKYLEGSDLRPRAAAFRKIIKSSD